MDKETVRVSADSTCDLSPELLEAYQIQIMPLYVVMSGVSYRDGVDITPDELYEKIRQENKIGTTAAINVDEYITFFRRQRESCGSVVHFTISGEMSSCYQNACIAADEVGEVYVVDSRNLSTGIGHLALRAAELARQGMPAREIAAHMERVKDKLDVSFIPSTLEFLRMGGRCSAVAALGANLLRLKPCIQVKAGSMGVGKKYTGSMEVVLQKYIRDRLANPEELDLARIFITHSGIDERLIQHARETLLACAPFREVLVTRAGCTVSNHCGPGTLGILFFKK